MNGATILNDTISQVHKQAEAFDTALKHASEKALWKKPKNKHASWVSLQTIELINTWNKAAKCYKKHTSRSP